MSRIWASQDWCAQSKDSPWHAKADSLVWVDLKVYLKLQLECRVAFRKPCLTFVGTQTVRRVPLERRLLLLLNVVLPIWCLKCGLQHGKKFPLEKGAVVSALFPIKPTALHACVVCIQILTRSFAMHVVDFYCLLLSSQFPFSHSTTKYPLICHNQTPQLRAGAIMSSFTVETGIQNCNIVFHVGLL